MSDKELDRGWELRRASKNVALMALDPVFDQVSGNISTADVKEVLWQAYKRWAEGFDEDLAETLAERNRNRPVG